ncbi:LytR family transcriptional regulator [Streptomyces albofaciens JCM 4342]|uniref:LCP family protein n=1 Tax=Streptomyces albofaciens TaxID=66866 RepID=UPI00123A121A|nr:LCP family protein [Streptomyces albofaciens]KAA6221514.1 LytR family transcriptional regulator [Streptomyces albofaciens JCM 4342]
MTAPHRPPRTPARHRRPDGRPRWGLRMAASASLLLLAAGGIGHAMVSGVQDGISRVDAFKGLGDRPDNSGGDGMNFLVVGTDGRDKLSREEKRRYHLGGEPCHCTDTIMMVHLSADRDRASVVSLPRDSYALTPPHTDITTGQKHHGHPVKLNAAYAEGGPGLTIRTVERMTGVHIDHYLEVDFTSFMKTVDAVGGVDICTTRPLKDSYTGLALPPGRSRLDGGQALQYVRARHLDSASDLGRMQRQQRFFAALMHKITSSGALLNPVQFKHITDALLESVRADEGFGADEMVDLGQALRGFNPSSSEFASVPVGDIDFQVPNVGSTVMWNEAKAKKLFQALREDRPLAARRPGRQRATTVDVPPGTIRVQVDNGAGRAGLGRAVDKALRATGFDTTGTPGNAPARVRRTVISYDPRWDRSVRSLSAALPKAALRQAPGQGSLLRVTVGKDFKAVHKVRSDDPTQPSGAGDFGTLTGDEAACP